MHYLPVLTFVAIRKVLLALNDFDKTVQLAFADLYDLRSSRHLISHLTKVVSGSLQVSRGLHGVIMPDTSTTEVKNPALCALCQSVLRARVARDRESMPEEEQLPGQQTEWCRRYRVTWYASVRSLGLSARSECEICSNVWDELIARGLVKQSEHLWNDTTLDVRLVERSLTKSDDKTAEWSLEMTLYDTASTQSILVGVHHFRQSSSQAPQHSMSPLEDKKQEPEASTRDLSIAKYWMNQCRREHPRCRPIIEQGIEWPTRLIQLWKEEDVVHARLVEGSGIPANVPYVSLSHCWGGSAVYTLELHRVSQFKTQIPMEKLAQTFKDAFEAVLQLGLSYVWVDSLCIVQDSKADWEAECQRMAGVYANATLTIAATASTSSETGLFVKKRSKNPAITCAYVDIKSEDTGLRGEYHLVHEHAWSVRVDYAPLNKRGWVLQERFFSTRILHFGKDQLLWECQKLQAAESISSLDAWPLRSNLREGYRSYRTLLRNLHQPYSSEDASTSDQEVYKNCTKSAKRAWNRILEAYTHAELTYSSDRLAAIAGITSRFETFLNDKCHQGLWSKDLFNDLLWYRTAGDSPRPAIRRAPSYTWACLDCPVAYEHLPIGDKSLIPCARIVGFEPDRQRIRMVARLPRGRLKDSLELWSDTSLNLTVNKRTYRVRAQFDAKATDFAETRKSKKGVRVYLLCMYALKYDNLTQESVETLNNTSYGLLLKKEYVPGQYSRVGRFVAKGDLWNECHPREDALDGYYTITLI